MRGLSHDSFPPVTQRPSIFRGVRSPNPIPPMLEFYLGCLSGCAVVLIVNRLRRPSRAWSRERALRHMVLYLRSPNPESTSRN